MTDIRVFDTSEALYSTAADQFLQAGEDALQKKAAFSVALAGGSTPLPLYEKLATDQRADTLAWEKTHFFWGDERTVGPDHADSNFRGANQALLEPRGVPHENIHRVQGELEPVKAADNYQQVLLDWFGEKRPRFDLILLGMGDDGHTASLFPGTSIVDPARKGSRSLVEAVQVPKLSSWRITFTPHLINAAAKVIFLVKGAEKAPALQAVLERPDQPAIYPAQLVRPEDGELIWLVDQDAAAELES